MVMNLPANPGLVIAPTLPLVAAILTMVFRRHEAVRDCIPVIGSVLTFFSVLQWMPSVLEGALPGITLFTLYPGISVSFCLDSMGLLFAGTASLLWMAASFYCIGYMRALQEHAQTRFYVRYAVAVGGAMGVAFAGNLFTLYVFYEIVTIFTYPLVAHHQDGEAYSGGRKYLVYLMVASKALLLPALALIYVQCGTLDFTFRDIGSGIFPTGADARLITAAYFLCLFGFAKAAIIPIHSWLPAAMVAPTPVSALLHAVVVVKIGVFSICRIMLSVFGTQLLTRLELGTATAWIASFTILTASLVAMAKTDLKARLAYSTVSQLSYIVLGVAMLCPTGITGGLIHITNHAFAKISLFFCAGAIIAATGKNDIRDMGGIGYQMPFTMGAFGIASLSMIGVPPVGGFVSKWYLALGSLDLQNTLLLGVVLVSSLLNAVYFGEVFLRAFFGAQESGFARETRNLEGTALIRLMVIPTVAAALLSVFWGLYPDLLLELINRKFGR